MVVSLTAAVLLQAVGIVIGIAAVIVTTTMSTGYNNSEATFGEINDNVTENITITVNVGGEPQQSPVQSGKGSLVMTTYLPVNITQTINLTEPTQNMTLYPIFERWDGLVEGDLQTSLADGNNNTVPQKGGIGVATILRSVVVTCTEPYFVNVTNAAGLENGGIQFENTTAPVSSEIAWGGPSIADFTEPQSGTLYYTIAGYGIVPANYNDNYDDGKFFENTGAGNQEINGTYHLSFVSFYPTTINLPKQAEMTSSLEIKCAINEDSENIEEEHDRPQLIEEPDVSHIYVYDVWFKVG